MGGIEREPIVRERKGERMMGRKKKGKTNRKPTPEPGTREGPLRGLSLNRASLETSGSIPDFRLYYRDSLYILSSSSSSCLPTRRLSCFLLLLLGARTCLREKRKIATAKHPRDVNISLLVSPRSRDATTWKRFSLISLQSDTDT